MYRGFTVLAAVVIQSLVGRAFSAAGGINTWCHYRDPFITDVSLDRTTYFSGANACKINTFDSPTNCPVRLNA